MGFHRHGLGSLLLVGIHRGVIVRNHFHPVYGAGSLRQLQSHQSQISRRTGILLKKKIKKEKQNRARTADFARTVLATVPDPYIRHRLIYIRLDGYNTFPAGRRQSAQQNASMARRRQEIIKGLLSIIAAPPAAAAASKFLPHQRNSSDLMIRM